MSKKIAEAMGLVPRSTFNGDVYDTDKVHEALSKAIKVSGNGSGFFTEPYDGVATHGAWLIGVHIKANKTADQLLDELAVINTDLLPENVVDLIEEIKDYKRRMK